MNNSDLDKRMRRYENVPKNVLMRRTPVIIRIDGRSFHTFTRGFNRPFDTLLSRSMQETTKYLCENIQNCVLGYTQSDEISLLLVDYSNLTTEPWFKNEVEKLCSVSASMATMKFNKEFSKRVKDLDLDDNLIAFDGDGKEICNESAHEQARIDYGFTKEFINSDEFKGYYDFLKISAEKGAMFDSRCFNIPVEEVTNYFYSRQIDAVRNSTQMVGQVYYSQKQLLNVTCAKIRDKLKDEKGVDWENFPTYLKRGCCCVKVSDSADGSSNWVIDREIPTFKGKGRDYIDNLIVIQDR